MADASTTVDEPDPPRHPVIAVVGAHSMVGWAIGQALLDAGASPALFGGPHTRLPNGWRSLDLLSSSDVSAKLSAASPRTVYFCGGICDVDKCAEVPERAHAMNVDGLTRVLDALPESARLVYLSSDHVFSGNGGAYVESTPPDPLSVYGETRVRAEALLMQRRPNALVVRGGLWVGPSLSGRNGHLDWLRYRSRRGLPMTLVGDEQRSAVWAHEAAGRVIALAGTAARGLHHVVAQQAVARPRLAASLCERFGIPAQYEVTERARLGRPHLGNVDLRTERSGLLAHPLPSALEPLVRRFRRNGSAAARAEEEGGNSVSPRRYGLIELVLHHTQWSTTLCVLNLHEPRRNNAGLGQAT